MNGKYSELPYTPCPPRGMASPSVHTPPEGTFIITDEPALTRHDHSEPTVHIGVRSRHVAQSTGFDKCAMTHIQHRNVAQNGFTASEILPPGLFPSLLPSSNPHLPPAPALRPPPLPLLSPPSSANPAHKELRGRRSAETPRDARRGEKR